MKLFPTIIFSSCAITIATIAFVVVPILNQPSSVEECNANLESPNGDVKSALEVCDRIAEQGLRSGDVKAMRMGGAYALHDAHGFKRMIHFYSHAVNAGDNASRIDLSYGILESEDLKGCDKASNIMAKYIAHTASERQARDNIYKMIEMEYCKIPLPNQG